MILHCIPWNIPWNHDGLHPVLYRRSKFSRIYEWSHDDIQMNIPNIFLFFLIWGFPARHGGTPIAGWFIRKNPIKDGWFGGTPISGNHHMMDIDYQKQLSIAEPVMTVAWWRLHKLMALKLDQHVEIDMQNADRNWNRYVFIDSVLVRHT